MKYDIKEYTPVFDIHYKKEYAMMQERVVAEKIMKLLNDNKYDDIERFEQAMPSYSYFLKECNMDNVVMFFGKRFDDEEFRLIINNIKELTKEKLKFNSENIKTTKFENTNIRTFDNVEQDKTHYIVDDISDTPIEKQLEEKQKESSEFQTIDKDVNTSRMIDDMEKHQKESLNLQFLNDINKEILTNEELEKYNMAVEYQIYNDKIIRLDVTRGIISDEEDNIFKIENKEGIISIIDENGEKIYPDEEQKQTQTQYVYKLDMPNTAA